MEKIALPSINTCAIKANVTVKIYISYYSENFQLEIPDFSNLIIFPLPQKENLNQFGHIKAILDTFVFQDDEWIMFHDDDDMSLENRICVFLKEKDNCDTFCSQLGRVWWLEPSIYRKAGGDFGSTFSKVWILKEFLASDAYAEHKTMHICDCIFTAMCSTKRQIFSDEILYIAIGRGWYEEDTLYTKITSYPKETQEWLDAIVTLNRII